MICLKMPVARCILGVHQKQRSVARAGSLGCMSPIDCAINGPLCDFTETLSTLDFRAVACRISRPTFACLTKWMQPAKMQRCLNGAAPTATCRALNKKGDRPAMRLIQDRSMTAQDSNFAP